MNELSYKICRELKKAGWDKEELDAGETPMSLGWRLFEGKEWIPDPSLEELIDWCGDGFESLERLSKRKWRIYSKKEVDWPLGMDDKTIRALWWGESKTPKLGLKLYANKEN